VGQSAAQPDELAEISERMDYVKEQARDTPAVTAEQIALPVR
jgi:hypothetical protein